MFAYFISGIITKIDNLSLTLKINYPNERFIQFCYTIRYE